jgi:hypothetical protein
MATLQLINVKEFIRSCYFCSSIAATIEQVCGFSYSRTMHIISCSPDVFFSLVSGPCIRKSDEGDPLLLERDAQHQREQDLQVHHGQALQPAVDRGAQPHHRRAHHRFLSPSPTECSIVLTGYYSSTFVSAISAAHHHRWHGVRKVWCSTRL